MAILNEKTKKLERYSLATGELLAVEGFPVDKVRFVYSEEIKDVICTLIRKGQTLDEISQLEQMPLKHVIYTWRSLYPEFRSALTNAERDRGHHSMEKIVSIANQVEEEEEPNLPKAKFLVDTHLKIAEKYDPATYDKSKKDGAGGPSTIIINTNVPRDVKEEPIIIEVSNEEDTYIRRERQPSVEIHPRDRSGEESPTGRPGGEESGDAPGEVEQTTGECEGSDEANRQVITGEAY